MTFEVIRSTSYPGGAYEIYQGTESIGVVYRLKKENLVAIKRDLSIEELLEFAELVKHIKQNIWRSSIDTK